MPLLQKSSREKSLENEVRDEENPRPRHNLERQLDELRTKREIEHRRIEALKAEAEERRKERVAEQRLRAGSLHQLPGIDRPRSAARRQRPAQGHDAGRG